MNKMVVTMSEWSLSGERGDYNLAGIADYHPKLGRNTMIRWTSMLKRYSFEEDVLTYETRNTIYKCPLKYMKTECEVGERIIYDENMVKEYEASDNVLDRIIAASTQILAGRESDSEFAMHILKLAEVGKAEMEAAQKAEDERLIRFAGKYENCVYIEVSSINGGDKLAYHLGEDGGVLEPYIHVGTFQDSILYMEQGVVDFRYFPMGAAAMETYSWSDNIERAVIKNVQDHAIAFNHEEVAPGETKVFTAERHREGLFSPDCYNGKSILAKNGWGFFEDDGDD